jgi:hypothetical protein
VLKVVVDALVRWCSSTAYRFTRGEERRGVERRLRLKMRE